ncbi:uncharacterized protein LOC108672833 [Hyalella azteca]|uniref:Uncharacterized protein LOC108672833 n=1 Tax=Hyalella azteca TaxID=294128 RepID=A0A8B7NQQ0_HYAAZ|nr:uncharacterized protein LOC108672833 [Hyalella azteca]
MIVSGEAMKDKNNLDEASSLCKVEDVQSIEQSNYDSSNHESINCTSPPVAEHKFAQDNEAEVNLYDDMDPKNSVSSNGQIQQRFADPSDRHELSESFDCEQLIPHGGNSKQLHVQTPLPVISEAFSQLVSDTLEDAEVEVENNLMPIDSSANYDTQLSYHPSAAELPKDSNGSTCNGNKELPISLQFNQEEISFSATPMDSHDVNGSPNMHSSCEASSHVEEEVNDESDGSAEFNDEDREAAEAEHRKKAAVLSHKKDQSGDSSIMLVDSDDEGDCDDDLEGEEDLEEEELLEEEEEEDGGELEDYEEEDQMDGHYGSDHSSSGKSPSAQEATSLVEHSIETGQSNVPANQVRATPNEKNSSLYNGDTHNFLGRDHKSIMKKVRYNQEISLIKRKSPVIESDQCNKDDMEDLNDEEEGWQELAEWNQMKNEEMKSKEVNRDLYPTESHSRFHVPDSPQHHKRKFNDNVPNSTEARRVSKISGSVNINNAEVSCKSSVKEGFQSVPEPPVESAKSHMTHSSAVQDKCTTSPSMAAERLAAVVDRSEINQPPIIAQLNETKGYFEIGSCRDHPELSMHLLSITIVYAKQLSKIIPGSLLRSCKEGPHFQYSLLGCPVHTDPITNLSECEFPGERAQARVLATTTNLAQYLQQHCILSVMLCIGELELAASSVDLSTLVPTTAGEKTKVEGSYELVPLKGNIAGSSSSGGAVVGVLVELECTTLPSASESNVNRSTSASVHDENGKKVERVLSHLSEVSIDYAALNSGKKRARDNSASSNYLSFEASDIKDNSLAMSASRQLIRDQLKPPMKKRKLTENGGEKEIYSEEHPVGERSELEAAAKEDMHQWTKAQKNMYYKQVVLRDKKLQEALSKEWKQHVAGMEEMLFEQLQEVEEERAELEDQWRRLREREADVRRREDKLLELQQHVLEQQASLSSQLQQVCSNRRSFEPRTADRLRSITSGREEDRNSGGGSSSSKEFYKRQWLRGMASTHRRWATESGMSSSCGVRSTTIAGSSGEGSSAQVLPDSRRDGNNTSVPYKYDADIFDEITRLTKERRRLLSSVSPDSPQIAELDRTLQRLMDASGV